MAVTRHSREADWIAKDWSGRALLWKGKERLSVEAEGGCCGTAWNRNALEVNREAEKRKGVDSL